VTEESQNEEGRIDLEKYEGLTIDDWYKMNHHDWKDVVNEHNDLIAEVKRLREELRITQSNFSMVRNALANQYPEIEEAIWKVIE
tara:strand:- start:39 stop:293 length:255 start_codon:yes stop_codon:yes gene_type:complete